MATSLTDFSTSFSTAIANAGRARQARRRITPQAGHALEVLGHAIEYLTDEFIQNGTVLSAKSPELEAVQLLMGLNRQVYFECPSMPTMRERLVGALGLRSH